MATIARIPRAKGIVWKAIIKRRGRVLKTKTFQTKTAAREWARRMEADAELADALGAVGSLLRSLRTHIWKSGRGETTIAHFRSTGGVPGFRLIDWRTSGQTKSERPYESTRMVSTAETQSPERQPA